MRSWRCGRECHVLSAGAALQRTHRGVYVANPGNRVRRRAFPRRGDRELNAARPDSLQEFERGSRSSPTAERAPVRYIISMIPTTGKGCAPPIRMESTVVPRAPLRSRGRLRLWDCRQLPAGPQPKPVPVRVPRHSRTSRTAAERARAPSLALVTFDMPYSVSGITERNYHGTGLIVDAQRGLVVVDRNTVRLRSAM